MTSIPTTASFTGTLHVEQIGFLKKNICDATSEQRERVFELVI